jgi:hypothetical protein
MTEHTTVNVLPATNPVDLTGRQAYDTHNSGTNYVSGPRTTTVTTTSKSGCCSEDCIGITIFSIYGLSLLVARVAALGFFITGCISLAEENTHIPSCASHYKGWAIAMTVLFGLFVFQKNEDKNTGTSRTESVMAVIGAALVIVMLMSGLIAGLGYRDVYNKTPETCDVSGIPQLITWTEWILCYYLATFSLYTFAFLTLIITSRC